LNQTEILPSDLEDQDKVVMRTMASTHTIIWAEGGECISLLDPPGEYVKAAAECKNIGTWPVLVGDQTKHERDAMLSSPIILYDYPKIASESAGDLFDGTEIDEILTLRVMTMTDEEKAEMRDVDEHARRILERTETLPKDHLLQMHGTMRDLRQASEDFFNPKGQRRAVIVNGVELKAGDRVRIHPKKRADVFDIALSGKIAIIEAIEEDVQNEVHLALVLEDDPGRELGMARQPGHRFFYGVDEIEPV
jgi:hydrogenase maturation protease